MMLRANNGKLTGEPMDTDKGPTLFDGDEIDDAAWRCARAALHVRLNAKPTCEKIRDLADHMLRWTRQYGFTADHLDWLKNQVCDRGLEAVTTAELLQMLLHEFRPDQLSKAANSARPIERPPIDCSLCEDRGYRSIATNGTEGYIWCDCSAADGTKESCPNFLDLLNTSAKKTGPDAIASTSSTCANLAFHDS